MHRILFTVSHPHTYF